MIVSFETLLSTNCLETRPMYTYRCVCVCALNPSPSFKLDFVLIFIIMLVSFIFLFASFVNCVYSVCHWWINFQRSCLFCNWLMFDKNVITIWRIKSLVPDMLMKINESCHYRFFSWNSLILCCCSFSCFEEIYYFPALPKHNRKRWDYSLNSETIDCSFSAIIDPLNLAYTHFFNISIIWIS